MSTRHPALEAVVRNDSRYAYEAYEFTFTALSHTLARLSKKPGEPLAEDEIRHVTGPELLDGARDLALREFGLMARTVLRMWGIERTDDFGEIVFNLVEAGLMSKTAEDSRADFRNVFDLDEALVKDYRIVLDQAE